MATTYLQVSESISRKRDTAGQQVLTLTDMQTGQAQQVSGGGFDRLGTAFGMWLQATQQDCLIKLAHLAEWSIVDGHRTAGPMEGYKGQELIGVTFIAKAEAAEQKYAVHVDGGVGFTTTLHVAHACGLEVRTISNTARDVVLLIVTGTHK